MNMIRCAVLASLAVVGFSAPAEAAFKLIYVVIGVTDNGGADNTGVATSFHCSNNGSTPANARVQVRSATGAVLPGAALTQTIPSGGTVTFSTHPTVVFQDASATQNLKTGFVGQGRAAIFSEFDTVVCAADLVDAAAANPIGMPRRVIRFPRSTVGGED